MINICVYHFPVLLIITVLNYQTYLGFTFSVYPLLMFSLWLHYYCRILYYLILFLMSKTNKAKQKPFILKEPINMLQIIIKSYTIFFFRLFQCKEAQFKPIGLCLGKPTAIKCSHLIQVGQLTY